MRVDFTATGWCWSCQLGSDWEHCLRHQVVDETDGGMPLYGSCTKDESEFPERRAQTILPKLSEARSVEQDKVFIRIHFEGRMDKELVLQLWQDVTGGYPELVVKEFSVLSEQPKKEELW